MKPTPHPAPISFVPTEPKKRTAEEFNERLKRSLQEESKSNPRMESIIDEFINKAKYGQIKFFNGHFDENEIL